MDSVLDTLSNGQESRRPNVSPDYPEFDDSAARERWKKLGYASEYDLGTLFSGISDNDCTSRDFISKLGNAMSNIMRNIDTGKGKSKYSSQILDMVKACLGLYQQAWEEKSVGTKDDLRMIAAMNGFVNGYIKNGNIDSRV